MKAPGDFLRRWIKATVGPNKMSVSLKPQGVGRCGQEDGGVCGFGGAAFNLVVSLEGTMGILLYNLV
jgi:hypothetical protein